MDLNKFKEKPFFLTDEETRWVSETLEGMDTAEMAGQLFCVLGDSLSEEGLAELITDYNIGGVLFRPGPKAEIKRKYSSAAAMAKIPLIKAANLEEGGAGVITDGTYFGSCLQTAAADDMDCTRAFAKVCALEGRSVGVNWTFSPVADIDFNFRNPITNTRTFGSDPEKVLKNVCVFTDTIQKYGIAAAAKHFPGDGVDFRDQHLHPTYNSLSADEWYGTYGKIYKTLIGLGILSIMTGHIIQPEVIRHINPEASEADILPGSQSKELLTGVLREEFGFNGLIITDATIMGGYTMTMPRSEAIPRSIAAGADMLCFGTNIKEDYSYILSGLERGLLTEERLKEAVSRILAFKACISREYDLPEVDAKKEQAFCAGKAVTLVKDKGGLLPVTPEKYPDIRLVTLGEDETYDGSMTQIAKTYLEEAGFFVECYNPFDDDLHGTANLPEGRLTLMLCNMPAASNQTTVRIKWCPKHALEMPRFVNEEAVAFISFANPYHLQDVPRVRTYINAYTATKAVVEAALERLLGRAPFTGISPVDPFCGLEDTRL